MREVVNTVGPLILDSLKCRHCNFPDRRASSKMLTYISLYKSVSISLLQFGDYPYYTNFMNVVFKKDSHCCTNCSTSTTFLELA